MANIRYQCGFGNHFSSEAIPGAVPHAMNNPQRHPLNLYTEQLSGSAFTMPRHSNLRVWLYKLRPSVSGQTPYRPLSIPHFSNDFASFHVKPDQLRWRAPPVPETPTTFVEGISTVAGIGDPSLKTGLAIYMYTCNTSMENSAFYSADGDLLLVPQTGALRIKSEMGWIHAEPSEVVVIPRGIKFAVYVEGPSRGYISEVFAGHFRLPDLGPIGANGLANSADFEAPVASFEDIESDFRVIAKFSGSIFEYSLAYSVFDVVGWHGNYYPFKYDLKKFSVINTVSFDHPDPSIFTVLTCPSQQVGTAVMDFVIFPPRWMVGEKTFRPPYFHRNTMTEYMGNIQGSYDAKGKGFDPGCGSLHSCMSAHGPEKKVVDKAIAEELVPVKLGEGSLQFMFETCYMLRIAPWATSEDWLDMEYIECWKGLDKLQVQLIP